MTSSFDIIKADGSTFTIYALEGDGSSNLSLPRQVLSAVLSGGAGVNYFELGDDLTYRFVPGFTFNVIILDPLSFPPTANEGTYTVVTSSYVGNVTRVTVAQTIPRGFFTINGVTIGSQTWRISGNHAAEFGAGTSIIVTNNSGNGNSVYTVVSATVVGPNTEIVVLQTIPGASAGVAVVQFFAAPVFTPATTLGITAGLYDIRLAIDGGASSIYTVTATGTDTMASMAALLTTITGLTVTVANNYFTFTSGTTGTGSSVAVVTPTAGINPDLFAAIDIAKTATHTSISTQGRAASSGDGLLTVNSYDIVGVVPGVGGTWTIAGNTASRFPIGSGFAVSGNSAGDGNYSVASATNVGADTDIVVTATIPLLSDTTGAVLVGNIPLGHIQYHLTVADAGINTSFDLLGKGMPNWGATFQGDIVRALENHAASTPPAAPMSGQLWYDTGAATLNLFASTIYDIVAVDTVGPVYVWTISGNHAATFSTLNARFAVFGNTGINEANIAVPGTYSASSVYQILSAVNVGPNTEITINTTVSPPLSNSIPSDATGDGKLYLMSDWHEIALTENVLTLDWKNSVRAATTAALPAVTYNNGLSGVGATLTATANGALPAQDGVSLALNERLLVKNQASGLQNGIYTVTQLGDGGNPFILTRAVDADTNADVTAGMAMVIEEGATYNDAAFFLGTNNPITVGTTALMFVQLTASIAAPVNEIVYGTGVGVTSEADFTWDPTTDTLMLGGVGDLGTITNGDGGTIEFDAGVIRLTGDNGDFIEIGASINLTGVAGTTGSTITIAAGDSSVAAGGTVAIVGGDATLVAGGPVTITGGTGGTSLGTGTGGAVSITGGTAGANLTNGGAVNIRGGSGGVVGVSGGGAVNITAGDGVGATGGGGGSVVLTGGTPTILGIGGGVLIQGAQGLGLGNGSGGVVLVGANGAVAGGNGGSISITAGTATSVFTAGTLSLTAGGGGTTTVGGAVTITGGPGGTVSGTGGAVTITGGTPTSGAGGAVTLQGANSATGFQGGNATLQGGRGGSTNTGGNAVITGGLGGTTSGAGGNVLITGGTPTSGAGGLVVIAAGNATGSATGGDASLAGGTGGTTGTAGTVTIIGGAGGSTSGNGGSATLRGGSPSNGNGGSVIILGATAAGTGAGGDVSITGGNASTTGEGGDITLTAGNGATSRGGIVTLNGGTNPFAGTVNAISINGGSATNAGSLGNAVQINGGSHTTNQGGTVSLTGGTGGTSGTGGTVSLTGGTPGSTSTGGAISIAGGPGGSTSGAGGSITLIGGIPTDGNGGSITITGRNAVGTNRDGGNVTLTPGTATGSGTAGRVIINGPAKLGPFAETFASPSISAGTLTLDLTTANTFSVSLNQNITTLNINNPQASSAHGFSIIFTADGTLRTITWPGSVKWAGGTAPTMTATAGKVDILTFFTVDGGTNWYGVVSGQNF